VPLLLFAPAGAAGAQQDMQFPDATETVPELIELYSSADSLCRLSKSRGVKVKVACVSRALYGTALNERNWCYGKRGEANATMAWHACAATSLRFPAIAIPTL
jgi:hypothetical protein